MIQVKIILLFLFLLLCEIGCAAAVKPVVKTENDVFLADISKTIEMPAYIPPSGKLRTVSVAAGDIATMDGLLIDETAAMRIIELRIAYDEVYQLNLSYSKYMMYIIGVQHNFLKKTDLTIKSKNNQINKLQNSWWSKNKFAVGVLGGIIIGSGIVLLSGKIWSNID